MYDYSVALRRFSKLIKATAWKCARHGDVRMNHQDLEGEFNLVLVNCCQQFPEGQVQFARFFKTAMHNRVRDLLRISYTHKRDGMAIPLETLSGFSTIDQSQFTHWKGPHKTYKSSRAQPARFPRIIPEREKASQLEENLAPNSVKLLRYLLKPDKENVEEIAWKEFCRRNKLKSQGLQVTGVRRFRIKMRHLREHLGMSSLDIRRAVQEIKQAVERQRQ